jgi:hypothetical protein
LKIKLKCCHFDTTEVIEAELLAVLNILREHNIQDGFQKGRDAENGEYAQKGATSRVMVRQKFSFRPDGSNNSGNYG